MSHNALALIWVNLEERTDIANILHEVVGQHVVLQNNLLPDQTHELATLSLWRVITFFKISFDLQRSYLQSPQPSSSLERCLLAPRQLLFFLCLLFQTTKDDCFAGSSGSLGQADAIHVLLAQTLLSGIRILALQKQKSFASGRSDELRRIWIPTKEEVKEVEHLKALLERHQADSSVTPLYFALLDLSLQVLAELVDQSVSYPGQGQPQHCLKHEALDLPDFAMGLFPIKPKNVEVVQNAVACMERGCPQQLNSFWICFDAWWATTAASISLASKGPVSAESLAKSDTVQHFMERRHQIATAIFAKHIPPFQKWQPRWLILAGATHQSCLSEDCACFEVVLQSLQCNVPSVTSQKPWHPQVDQLFKSLEIFLIKRMGRLWESDHAITSLVTSVTKSLHEWTETQNRSLEEDTFVGAPWHVYVLGCPKMHPILADDLLQRIPYQEDRESIERAVPLLQLRYSVICPLCEQEYHVNQARLVQPLLNLAASTCKQRLAPLADLEADEFKDLRTTKGPAIRPSLVISRPSPPSSDQRALKQNFWGSLGPGDQKAGPIKSTSNTTPPSSPQRSREPSSEPSSKRTSWRFLPRKLQNAPVSVTHAFSASGKSIIVWTPDQLAIVSIRSLSTSIRTIAGISYAAAGHELVAVIVSDNCNHNLKISHDVPEMRANIGIDCDVYSLAVSLHDAQVAVGSANQIGLYSAASRQLKWVSMPATPVLPDAKNVQSQVMAFSSDGQYLAVATHYDVQAVRVCVLDWYGVVVYSMLYGMPPTISEGPEVTNISAIACDGASGVVYLSAFDSQTFPRVFNFRNQLSKGTPVDGTFSNCPGTRIQCAAGCIGESPEPHFAIVNDKNIIFRLRKKDRRWGIRATSIRLGSKERKTVHGLDERMSIAMTSPEDVLLFWVEQSNSLIKGVLATSRIDQTKPAFQEVELKFSA